MQAWWRVLRGAWPYRMAVVISMICALGVGFSYAAGVGVLYPVMKIFISVEGIHGWANRTAAAKRLDVGLLDLDGIVKRNERPQRGPADRLRGDQLCLIVASSGKHAPPALHADGEHNKFVLSVKGTVPRQLIDQHKWGELVKGLDDSKDSPTVTVEFDYGWYSGKYDADKYKLTDITVDGRKAVLATSKDRLGLYVGNIDPNAKTPIKLSIDVSCKPADAKQAETLLRSIKFGQASPKGKL